MGEESLVFDLINAVVATLALALGAWGVYLQYRKISRLSMTCLKFGVVYPAVNNLDSVALTVAFANTGSAAAIVTALYLVYPHKDGQGGSMMSALATPSKNQVSMEPLAVAAGTLVRAQMFFQIHVDERTMRDEQNRIPLKLHVEMIDGKGRYIARTLKGFTLGQEQSGRVSSSWYPFGRTAPLLPKPISDLSEPMGIHA
jgi:hypothetical protein